MSDYFATQAQQNTRYKAEYAKWVAGLTPKQRRQLQAQGLLEAQVDPLSTAKGADITELPLADPSTVLPEIEPAPPQHHQGPLSEDQTEVFWDSIRLLIANLLHDPNPALGLECLAVVSGIGFEGESMTEIARRHRVTRAAVSKRCVQWTNQLGLVPSRSMRSLTARSSYQQAQKRKRNSDERFNSSQLPRPSK
jgi:hypothetical protein